METFDILSMVTNQAERFAEAFPNAGPGATIYGVVFVLSLLTAAITFGFVVFKRESGGTSASLIVQFVAVWLLPAVGPTVMAAFTGEVAPEAMRMITSIL